MNKRVLYSVLLTAICLLGYTRVSSQVLEEVNLTFTTACNTYLTGINNMGFVTGYYDSAGIINGFIINPNGKIKRFPGTSGTYDIKIEGINDHNVCAATIISGGNGVAYKAYYDTLTEEFTNLIPINGVGYYNVNVFDINDNNDVAGWYPNLSERWLWYNRDSVSVAYDARRHNSGGYQPTYGGGINNNGIIGSFFINGSNYEPLFFDISTSTFTPISGGTTKMKIWDVNNNNVIAGEYQVGGYWVGFWAQTVGSNITMIHPLTPIFEVNTPTIQSVVNGINDKFEMVGSYLDPGTSTWRGFIYRPFVDQYRFPGYDWSQHTWSMQNTSTGPNAVWTTNFYGGFNYSSVDPFKTSNPMITPFLQAMNPALSGAANNTCADWKSFAEEIDSTNIENEAGNLGLLKYLTWKPLATSRWVSNGGYFTNSFPGICYGFAFTSLLKATGHEDLLNTWFGVPMGVGLNGYTNNNATAVRAITRTYLKQYDKRYMPPYFPATQNLLNPWSGLYRLKNTYLDTSASRRNPRAIYIGLSGTNSGYHSILPYKINTPKKFPFFFNGNLTTDTLWVYDSNFPNDSTQYFLVNSNYFNNNNTVATNSSYPNLQSIIFNEAGVKEMLPVAHSQLKSTSVSLEDPTINITLNPSLYYSIEGNGSTFATYNSGGHSNDIPYMTAAERKDQSGSTKPLFYNMDTSGTINVSSTNYTDSRMEWNMNGSYRSMGLNRAAQLNETDNGTWHNHIMTYGTHDNVTKELTGYLVETNGDFTQGVSILVQNISMNQNDSILTENPEQYVYKITRFGSNTDTYDIWMDVTGVDSIQTFHFPGIVIEGNSSHTITPYFNGTSTEVGVIVDNGLDGSLEDTLFIFSVGVNNVVHNVDYVKVYPNPMQKLLSVELNTDKDMDLNITLMDITGRVVARQTKLFKTGKTIHNIETANLPAGTYIINITDANGKAIFRQKMLK